MATPPTDDPRDRTVGVRKALGPWIVEHDGVEPLKREALLFDQIAIPDVDKKLAALAAAGFTHVNGIREVCWLRDVGIVRDVPPFTNEDFDSPVPRQCVDAMLAEMGEPPIDDRAIDDERVGNAVRARLIEALNEPGFLGEVLPRINCIKLRHNGINAFPILESRREIRDAFPSGTASDTLPVLEVILRSMPIPDDQTPWEDIIDFRNDRESMKRLRALRVWVRKFAKATPATSLAEMKDEIEVLLDDYEEHMKLHRMKVNKGAAETLVTVGGKVAEDLVKLKWGELAKLPFILRERKISLLEAEANAPNRELAFVSIARSRFSR